MGQLILISFYDIVNKKISQLITKSPLKLFIANLTSKLSLQRMLLLNSWNYCKLWPFLEEILLQLKFHEFDTNKVLLETFLEPQL